ncbi:hypothetical protein HELRODRAFT_180571 [Helobdella robusta]|uniref:Stabilizer of axonemal microtubules 2 n=1 Tax=Helobdella robusta TaxID=6412 RepID=T1FG21_HELRO|nr:hypothetical protein HELRODRAFT_180571 [Helobdella robusta]ESN93707.1 hypothetical protein HELRODRAFT_180571 [Helobdella robusta]
MTKKCICQICTCGRHKCPHNPNPTVISGPCPFSEYTQEYKEHPLEARVNYKPQYQLKTNQGPMDDMTTHKFDYIPYEVEKPYKRQTEAWQKPEGNMEVITNYHKDFTEKPLDIIRSFKPEEVKKSLGKFEGEPTYQADYKPWESKPRVKFGPPEPNTQLSDQPFHGNTNYQTDFIPYKTIPSTKSMKPITGPVHSDAPFIDATDYKESYVQYPIEAKIAKAKVNWQPTDLPPMDDLSSYKKDYIAKDSQKPVSFKPDQTPYSSQAAFDETTTHKTDFMPWLLDLKRPNKRTENYQKPDGQMTFDTTTQLDYPAYPNQPPTRVIPNYQDSFGRDKPRFDATTNYTIDYKRWSVQGTDRVKKLSDYVPSDVPFNGIPTYQTDFVPKQLVFTKSARPVQGAFKSDAPLDDSTEYKVEFFKKSVEPCPVPNVKSGADSRYEFVTQDDVGHLWYRIYSASHGQKNGAGGGNNSDGRMIPVETN